MEQRNDKPLTKAERFNLRELVRNSAILMWYAGLAPHKQRQLTHPNRIIVAWKAANRSATGDDAKPSLAKTQQRIILQQDEEIAGHKQRVTTMQALLEDRDWKAAEHIEDKVAALGKELRTRNAGEQVRAVRLLADRLGITADLLKLLMRKSKGGGR